MIFLEKMTLGALALGAAERYKNRTAFQIYRDGEVYDQVSYREFGRRVRQFAGLLAELGVGAGDRVMILAENRPEWPIAYFGTALAGAVTVPVLTELAPAQIAAIADHAGIRCLCYTGRTAPRVREALPNTALPLVRLDGLEGDEIPVRRGDEEKTHPLGLPREGAGPSPGPGEAPPPDGGAASAESFPQVESGDLASIVYTSGTTGRSKGVMLSHRNLLFVAHASRNLMKIFSRDRLLSVIPLAHTYECTLGLLTVVMSGASVTYLDRPPSPAVLLPAMQTLRPTALVSVPLFIEKIYRNQIAPGLEANPLFRFKAGRFLAVKLGGQKLLAALGGAVRFFGIGGAPLAEDVEAFLRRTGFPYSPGYGLTEAAPLVTGTAPYRFPPGASGRILKGVEVRIVPAEGQNRENPGDSAGEIQVRGPNVMMGYYRDPEGTRDAFAPGGWLKTGDLGIVDKKGFLYIRGRLKALILGPSGENIYPEEIENILHRSLLVEDALVVPGRRGELVALVVLSERAKTAAAALGDSLEELKNAVNKRLAAFSRLSRIEIRSEPFEKTATAKIKRFLYTAS
jgi:long-chain acyl-CoA synthetase